MKKVFLFKKLKLKLFTDKSEQNLIGSIKFENPDKYLVSLKSKAGIEVARIFITSDTILINDRINKKQYYGSAKYLKKKFGITTSVLPLIFGDYINENVSDNVITNCSEGKSDIVGIIKNINISYVIDCKKGKSIISCF